MRRVRSSVVMRSALYETPIFYSSSVTKVSRGHFYVHQMDLFFTLLTFGIDKEKKGVQLYPKKSTNRW